MPVRERAVESSPSTSATVVAAAAAAAATVTAEAAAAATAAAVSRAATAATASPSISTTSESNDLRTLFDAPSTMRGGYGRRRDLHYGGIGGHYGAKPATPATTAAAIASAASDTAGLFQYPTLKTPETFLESVNAAIARGYLLVERIAHAPERGEQEMKKVIKLFDRLSDVLCKVIDAAELVRCLHPDPAWRQSAETVYEELFSWMNTLNTDPRLYSVLKRVVDTPAIERGLSAAERQVALVFLRDFEKSGIHLSDAKRADFVRISDKIVGLGRDFIQRTTTPGAGPAHIMVSPPSRLQGLSPTYIQRITRTNKMGEQTAAVPTTGWEAQMVLKHVEDEGVRRAMYVASMAEDKSKVAILDDLLRSRYELAQLVGMESYGDMFLVDKMVKDTENVAAFMTALYKSQMPAVSAEVELLRKAKEVHTKDKDAKLQAWDRDFYARMVSARTNTQDHGDPINAYFSVGTTMDGLSKLFSRLYGIRFVAGALQPGEVWHEDVQRLDVIDEREGLIGTIYCDLYAREGKQMNAAHYTVRCARRVDDDDEVNDVAAGMQLRDGVELAMADPGVTIQGKPGRYQLPLAVLSCGFSRPSGSNSPTLLSWVEVETLFHEMGHAMHSMIGRTDYHNVSGTRCPIDFVEIPSILMEHFLADPTVLGLFATHYKTGAPLPAGLLTANEANRSTFRALELHSQMTMAILDQLYYSSMVGKSNFNSTGVMEYLQNKLGVVPSVPGTAWQTGFGHLYGYGAGYYSYIFGKTVTGQIWDQIFRASPTSREAGERLREHVLKWGGGKDPWACLGGLLEDERLCKGDKEAMRIVGDWGTARSSRV
ncbi:Mitochondrial intermediate peptidase [Actinomortierella ambigua]|uniref:mitochondrial intermediate peptidase n=1 Tax=Actinomortierella ambigua TaxID=1343610 RepID=A0A9P6QLV8_9FUNG|nr:Mitochondrial intermediate peptidase [Actinomortierella ambigua]